VSTHLDGSFDCVYTLLTWLFFSCFNDVTKHEGFYIITNLDFTFVLACIEFICMVKVGMLINLEFHMVGVDSQIFYQVTSQTVFITWMRWFYFIKHKQIRPFTRKDERWNFFKISFYSCPCCKQHWDKQVEIFDDSQIKESKVFKKMATT
jgi:hypothetical protein